MKQILFACIWLCTIACVTQNIVLVQPDTKGRLSYLEARADTLRQFIGPRKKVLTLLKCHCTQTGQDTTTVVFNVLGVSSQAVYAMEKIRTPYWYLVSEIAIKEHGPIIKVLRPDNDHVIVWQGSIDTPYVTQYLRDHHVWTKVS